MGDFTLPETFAIEPERVTEFPNEVLRERLPIIDVAVEDGQAQCVGVRRPSEGPPLTTESIRLPLAELIRAAAYAVARERRTGAPALGPGARDESSRPMSRAAEGTA